MPAKRRSLIGSSTAHDVIDQHFNAVCYEEVFQFPHDINFNAMQLDEHQILVTVSRAHGSLNSKVVVIQLKFYSNHEENERQRPVTHQRRFLTMFTTII